MSRWAVAVVTAVCGAIILAMVGTVSFAYYVHYREQAERRANDEAADAARRAQVAADAKARAEHVKRESWRVMTWLKAAAERIDGTDWRRPPESDAVLGTVQCNKEGCRSLQPSRVAFWLRKNPRARSVWHSVEMPVGEHITCESLGLRQDWDAGEGFSNGTGCSGLPGQVVISMLGRATSVRWYSREHLDNVEPKLRDEWAARRGATPEAPDQQAE